MKRRIKEIWIRFKDEADFREREEELKEMLYGMPGKCKVIVYLNESNKKAIMSAETDEKQIDLLENAFGQENVRYQEREVETEKCEQHIVPRIVQIIPCNHDMYAVFSEDGEELGYKVLMYALCDDGRVYPLIFDKEFGISSVEDAAFYAKRFELEGGEITLQEGKPE